MEIGTFVSLRKAEGLNGQLKLAMGNIVVAPLNSSPSINEMTTRYDSIECIFLLELSTYRPFFQDQRIVKGSVIPWPQADLKNGIDTSVHLGSTVTI